MSAIQSFHWIISFYSHMNITSPMIWDDCPNSFKITGTSALTVNQSFFISIYLNLHLSKPISSASISFGWTNSNLTRYLLDFYGSLEVFGVTWMMVVVIRRLLLIRGWLLLIWRWVLLVSGRVLMMIWRWRIFFDKVWWKQTTPTCQWRFEALGI